MPARTQLPLEPHRVYRTRDFAEWTTNPSRTAKRLVEEGTLEQLAQGLFVCPKQSRFGRVPPDAREIMRAFLYDEPFVLTGSEQWNALRLGSTSVFPMQLVYNTKRSGEFTFGGLRFFLRRVAFPEHPTPEWFAVDLLEHRDMAGVSLDRLRTNLALALAAGRLAAGRLQEAARLYGTKRTQEIVAEAAAVTTA